VNTALGFVNSDATPRGTETQRIKCEPIFSVMIIIEKRAEKFKDGL